MDFRFKYNRVKPTPPEIAREKKEEIEVGKQAQLLSVGLSIPFTLGAGPVAGWLLGAWLDKQFHTSFWMIVLILLGIGGSLKLTIDQLSRLGKS